MSTITSIRTLDIRFPTSIFLDGSDAMNPDPDYSAAYLRIETDSADGLTGDGFVFTIGRGNDIQANAIEVLAARFVGRDAEELLADMGATWREMLHDSQLRWLGPEKGVMHMAIGAVINALWDLRAKRAGQPLWQHLASLTPEELVDLVDLRYLSDALTREEALDILRRGRDGADARTAELLADGYPAYTTGPGWLGYSDEKLERLASEAVADGFRQIKLKVGADLDDDLRRLALARRSSGPTSASRWTPTSGWDVDEAVDWMSRAGAVRPRLAGGADEPGRRARPRRDRAPARPDAGGHRRARAEPGGLQADAAGQVAGGAAAGRLPGRRREREHLDPAAGRQVRDPGVPARRRCGAVRDGPAPVVLRLRGGLGVPGRAHDRVRRPPARALRHPGVGRRQGATRVPTPPGSGARCSTPRSRSGRPRLVTAGRRHPLTRQDGPRRKITSCEIPA
jgi:L-alanine-DL-glutamate epimerase-like enolase superfamily enzyme